jgi:hypothetical protein
MAGEVRVRASADDLKRLAWLAKDSELTASDVIRQLIAREYAARKKPKEKGEGE